MPVSVFHSFLFKGIIKKYSNFVGSPIFLNGKRANTVQVSSSFQSITAGYKKIKLLSY